MGNSADKLYLDKIWNRISEGPFLTVPKQTGLCQYTGETLTPEWDSYNPNTMEIDGTVEAVNAGVYTASVVPKNGYLWIDGTDEKKEVIWEIKKAHQFLSIDNDSVSAAYGVQERVLVQSLNVASENLSAFSNNEHVATVSVDGNNIFINVNNPGSAQVFVRKEESENYFASNYEVITVSVYEISKTLGEVSWGDISSVSMSGKANDFWQVGDKKTIHLTSGESVVLAIMGFSHDDLSASTGKAGITFGTVDLLSSNYKWGGTSTDGGFTESLLYKYLNNDIYNNLPNDLKETIKSVKKGCASGPEHDATVNSHDMKLFSFSLSEIGIYKSGEHTEGTAYNYFSTANNRIKKLNGTASQWWTRTLEKQSDGYAWFIDASGSGTSARSNIARGVCFGFCV